MREEKKNGNIPKAIEITVRELVNKFGYHRRTYRVVGEIQKTLKKYQLHSTPEFFEILYIDTKIKLDLDDNKLTDSGWKPPDAVLRIGSLEAAHNKPVQVAPDNPIVKATTIMQRQGYSQLPVMVNDRCVKGVISWRSIGEAYAHKIDLEKVKDCMEKQNEVDIDMPLMDAMDQIYRHDYVLVRNRVGEISGIITSTDIAYQFKQHSQPFLLIGEIERNLRSILHNKFTIYELIDILNNGKQISGPHDLSIGDYKRLLESKENWDRLELYFDQKEFIRQLDEIRVIRNTLMHFSTDELDEEQVAKIQQMVKLLRTWYSFRGR